MHGWGCRDHSLGITAAALSFVLLDLIHRHHIHQLPLHDGPIIFLSAACCESKLKVCSMDGRSRFLGDIAITMSDASTSAVHAPAGFPVQTMLFTRTICDLPTDFSFTRYTDQTLLIITQIGTAGAMGYHVGLNKYAWAVWIVSLSISVMTHWEKTQGP